MAQRRRLLAWVVFLSGVAVLSSVAGWLALLAPPGSEAARWLALVMIGAALLVVVGCVAAAAHLVAVEYRSQVVPLRPMEVSGRVVPVRPALSLVSRSPQAVELPVGSEPVWPLLDWRQP